MQTDLIALIESDLGPGKKSGRWVMFRCPFHEDHKPSLAANNGDERRGPFWKCFTCSDKKGGPLQWLMQYRGLSFEDARRDLGAGQPGPGPTHRPEPPPPPPATTPPSALWQKRAWEIINGAQAALWGEPGRTPIRWAAKDPLTGQLTSLQLSPLQWLTARGLAEDTLRLWKVGYIPRTWKDDSTRWGLTGSPLWIPQGILIPCFDFDRRAQAEFCWYLKVRKPQGDPKYIHIRKSQPALYMAQTLDLADTAVFCEGELDALLLWQEAQDLAAVVSLGSATNELNLAAFGFHLLGIRYRLMAYDLDKAGQQGADKLAWLQTARLSVPRLQPGDKDLTDFWKSGGNLYQWLLGEIDRVKAECPKKPTGSP